MSKSNTQRRQAGTPAPVSPPIDSSPRDTTVPSESATAKPAKTPRVKVHKSVLSGPAYAKLVAANAVLITIASKGFLHDRVTSKIEGGSIGAKELGGVLPGLVANWEQFDSGYLAGKSASYGICSVITRGKKAKTNPAFLWATPGVDGAEPTLYTALGDVWSKPPGTGREADAYSRAMQFATAHFSPAK